MNVHRGHWYWCWPTKYSSPEVVLVTGSEGPVLWVKLLNGETMLVVDVWHWGLEVHEPDTLYDVPVRMLERIRDTARAVGYAASNIGIAATARVLARFMVGPEERP
mgnify:CR=1 FL=1